jgi:hypothetical protein
MVSSGSSSTFMAKTPLDILQLPVLLSAVPDISAQIPR